MVNMQDKYGLLSQPIASVLFKKTLPAMYGIVSILLMNLADIYFIAMLGTDALAAISYTFPVTFALNSLTMGIGLGLATFVGRSLGEDNYRIATRYATHGILLALFCTLVISFVGITHLKQIFLTLGALPHLLPLISDYMVPWFLGVPLLTIPMVGNAAIRAKGNTNTPSQIMLLAAIINAILDPILIFGLGWIPALGVFGAALASVISWGVALIWSLKALIIKEKLLTYPKVGELMRDCFRILKIATPAAFSNALAPISGAIMMKIISYHGVFAVAAYGAAQRIESLLLLVVMSLSSVLMSFMSQNIGAKDHQRSFDAFFLSIHFILSFQLIIFFIILPLSSPFTHLFSGDSEVQKLLWLYLVTVPFSYGFQGVITMLISAFNALQQPLNALKWSALRLFLFTLPLAFGLSWVWDVKGLFIGVGLGNVIGGIFAYRRAIQLRNEHG